MSDQIETFGHSVIQHGPSNDRAYVMKVGPEDCPNIVDYVVALAEANDYSKIFVKAPVSEAAPFLDHEFVAEAEVPGLFKGREDGLFLSRFLSPQREQETRPELVSEVLEATEEKQGAVGEIVLPADHSCRIMGKDDTGEMADIYRQVFASYPFPVHDPEYLAATMDDNLLYYGVWAGDDLVAVSSAEIDFDGQNAEMTDFATLPECRGHGLGTFLLDQMEHGLRQIGIRTAYTIARSYSYGMNITFAKHDYAFTGTLVNNTQISGSLESMNVWYKPLLEAN